MKTIKSRIPAYVITALLLIALTACQSEQAAEIVDIAALTPTNTPCPAPTPTPVMQPPATPAMEPTPEPTPEVYEAKLGFVGDILMMTRQISDAKTDTGYDFSASFANVAPLFASMDIMCANFEGTLGGAEGGYTQPRATMAPATAENPYPTRPPFQSFSAPDELAKNLFDAGVDVVTLANNHAMDRDDAGLFRSIETLRAAGISTTGAALSQEDFDTPCILEANGIKIGFVGATQILNSTAPSIDAENRAFAVTMLNEDMAKRQIMACADAGAEFIIVLVHWGYEHQSEVDSSQRKYAEKLIQWGADAIIGSHSHCPQPMEWMPAQRDGKELKVPVVYSLGNFISNMSQRNARIGVFAGIKLIRDGRGVRCAELGCIPLYCCRMDIDESGGAREAHTVLPCFLRQGEEGLDAGIADESVKRAMLEAYEHVKSICIGDRDDIKLIEWSDIYAGEA